MANMTKALNAKLARLETAKAKASDLVYAVVAPRNDIPFNDCYEKASAGIRQSYHVAVKELEDFRYAMVVEGRAWLNEGRFVAYSA